MVPFLVKMIFNFEKCGALHIDYLFNLHKNPKGRYFYFYFADLETKSQRSGRTWPKVSSPGRGRAGINQDGFQSLKLAPSSPP